MARMTHAAVAALIDAIGTARFDQVFLETARDLCGADHYSAFRFGGDGEIRYIGSATVGGRAEARLAADKFVSRLYWRLDPAHPHLHGRTAQRRPLLLRFTRHDIADPAYRHDCYEAPGIIDRISLYRDRMDGRGGTARYRLSLYRKQPSDPFPDEAIAAIEAAAEPLLAAVAKHAEHQPVEALPLPAPRLDLAQAMDRLLRLGGGLTAREVEVLARALMGKTSEGIALDLDIAPSSVVTYRKRAYRKLGITGQPELFALVLGAEPRAA